MATEPVVPKKPGMPPLTGGATPAQGKVSGPPPIPTILNPNGNAYLWNDDKGMPVLQDVGTVKKYIDILPPDKMDYLVKTMDETYGKGKWKYSDLVSGWGDAADMSASYKSINGSFVSVFDTFGRLAQMRASNGLTMGGKTVGGGAGGGPSYAKQTSIRLTDPTTARGLVDSALNNYLGRNATEKEREAFRKALNMKEQAAPTVTEQVTTPTGKRSSSTMSTTTGGFDPATFAKEYAAGVEGAGEFQAATSLLDSFIQAIGAKI